MKQRKIPMRKDIISGEMFPKKELVRIVKDENGQVVIDPTGKKNGRGAYVAMEPELVKKAWEKKSLNKILDATIDDQFYEELYNYVDHKKARKELLGK